MACVLLSHSPGKRRPVCLAAFVSRCHKHCTQYPYNTNTKTCLPSRIFDVPVSQELHTVQRKYLNLITTQIYINICFSVKLFNINILTY